MAMEHTMIHHSEINSLVGEIIVGGPVRPARSLDAAVLVDDQVPGAAMDMGKRSTMEDSCAMARWVNAQSGRERIATAVFDGHGGDHAVKRVALELIELVAEELECVDELPAGTGDADGRAVVHALTRAFWRMQTALECELNGALADSGTTATVVLWEGERPRALWTAWVGDSPAFVATGRGQHGPWQLRKLTPADHRVNRRTMPPEEAERLADLGVHVGEIDMLQAPYEWLGAISMTRALGDLTFYKPTDAVDHSIGVNRDLPSWERMDLLRSRGERRQPSRYWVSPTPSVTCLPMDPRHDDGDDRLLLLMTDGVSDYVPEGSICREHVAPHWPDSDQVARALMGASSRSDNKTVLTVRL